MAEWSVAFSSGKCRAAGSETHALLPIETIALAGGPMNTIPLSSSFLANVAFSDRNP